MQTLSIDIETYSDVNLSKCGVYKYAESPDFEILLFGYSADGSEVTVIDLAQGERLPQEIIDALTDDRVDHDPDENSDRNRNAGDLKLTERIRNSRDKVPNQYSYGHAEQYPHRKITLKCIYAFA